MKTKQPALDAIQTGFYLIFFATGLIWLYSIYGKFVSGTFVSGLGKTLTFFASKNPYPFVKEFLLNTAIPNSQIFAVFTMAGELFAAVSLIYSVVVIIRNRGQVEFAQQLLFCGLVIGCLLNIIFFFSAGWTSPSTWSINALMALIQTVGAASLYKNLQERPTK